MNMHYISGGTKFNTNDKNVSAPLIRKLFYIEHAGSKATLYISAVGFYRVFLNGKELTKGFFAPYISNPDDLIYYDVYDVTDILGKQNVICVLLGNGFGNALDCGIWDFDKAPFRAAPKCGLKLFVKEECVLESDESFDVFDSPITFDDLRFGEHFDARLLRSELFEPIFVDGCRKAIFAATPKGELRECKAQPVRSYEQIKPCNITEYGNGYIYDFGKNNAGVYRLDIDGQSGQKVKMMFFELMRNGKPFRDEMIFAYRNDVDYDIQRDEYICVDGNQSYIPSFTYHGYRYVYVEGITKEQATKKLLTYIVLHSDIPATGKFSCSDGIINKVDEITTRSDLSNFYYFPTDCPHREKNGWTGDAVCGAEQLLYHFDCSQSLTEWLYNIVKAQRSDGVVPGIVPTGGWGFSWGNGPAWDAVIVEIPYQIYKITGDIVAVKIAALAIEKYFEYVATKKNADGLLEYGLGDWCEMGGRITTPLEVTDTLTIIDMTAKAEELFVALGNKSVAEKCSVLHNELVAAFRKKYIKGGRIAIKTQTAIAMSLEYGVFIVDEIEYARADLKAAMNASGGKMQIGVLGAKVLFNALTKAGMTDIAYNAVRGPEYPSYGYLLKHEATTLWESFVEMEKDELPCDSYNHYFWGSVTAWFYRSLAGLNITSHNTVEINPHPINQLDYAEAEYALNGRKISVKWQRDGDAISVNIYNENFSGIVKIDGYSADGKKECILKYGENFFMFTATTR